MNSRRESGKPLHPPTIMNRNKVNNSEVRAGQVVSKQLHFLWNPHQPERQPERFHPINIWIHPALVAIGNTRLIAIDGISHKYLVVAVDKFRMHPGQVKKRMMPLHRVIDLINFLRGREGAGQVGTGSRIDRLAHVAPDAQRGTDGQPFAIDFCHI